MTPLVSPAERFPQYRCRAVLIFVAALMLFALAIGAFVRGGYWIPSGSLPPLAPEVPIIEQMLIGVFYWFTGGFCLLAGRRCVFASDNAWIGYLPAAQ